MANDNLTGTYRRSDEYWVNGMIVGEDGKRYRFRHADLAAGQPALVLGEKVHFSAEGGEATAVRPADSGGSSRRWNVGRPGPDPAGTIPQSADAKAAGDGSAAALSGRNRRVDEGRGTGGRAPSQEKPESDASSGWWLWPLIIGLGIGAAYFFLTA